MRQISRSMPFAVLIAALISPAIASFAVAGSRGIGSSVSSLLVAVLFFLLPTFLFYRNVKLYFYLLSPLVVLNPVLLFSIYCFGLQPGFELIAFVLQTNSREAREAIGPFILYFFPLEIVFVGLYFYTIQNLRIPLIATRTALGVSAVSFALLSVLTYYSNALYYKSFSQIHKSDLILKYDYPFSLLGGVIEARNFLKKNNLVKAENFTFGAVKNDTLRIRQVYVLIIGESSRYDRWQINGYDRATSPRLSTVTDLLSYRDVVSGAHYTWVSVPQIITRANPDNYDLQYKEKSILGLFQEAGFKTYWLSNQSDQDIFWSGSIILHARTADVATFSPTYSPNMEFENIYDGRLLPILDSVLNADRRNLFIVLHTMGNHWEYSRRYPPEFDVFQPSGTTHSINPPNAFNREAILNSYDNSIVYADYIIHGVIGLVKQRADLSSVMFISDHGEDLFDAYGDRLDFHLHPSPETLKVPLFIWTSDSYKRLFPEKRMTLERNVFSKLGAENIFYTLADMASIRMEGFDETKSFASENFRPSEQKFYDDDKHARPFAHLSLLPANENF